MSARQRPPQVRLRDRTNEGQPLVSVLTPCYNHGRYLRRGLETVAAQAYPAVEAIVVDDGSDDAETLDALDCAAAQPNVTLVRHEGNRGVAVAMNTAVEAARGRYVMPFDADNELLPNALADLVAQLNAAPPSVGYVYPVVQFFGNRNDRYRPPAYNLFTLLQGNYCDHCSLIDRDVFAQGVTYRGGLWREDWHLFLEMAKRGVHGERGHTTTLRYRKRGFNRSELVGHAKGGDEVDDDARARHPEFWGSQAAYAAVKSDWLPALSILALTPASEEERHDLHAALERQTCLDAEVIVPADDWPEVRDGPCVRTLARELGADPGRALEAALTQARGRMVALAAGTGIDLVRDATFVERVLRVLASSSGLSVLAFMDAGGWPWRRLDGDPQGGDAHAVVWSQERLGELRGQIQLRSGPPVAAVLDALSVRAQPSWWALPGTPGLATLRQPATVTLVGACADEGVTTPQAIDLAGRAVLPGVPSGLRRRERIPPWCPPQARPVFRHVHRESAIRVVTHREEPPAGYRLEYRLGTVKLRHLPGTLRLDMSGAAMGLDVDFSASEELVGPVPAARALGWIESASLPMLAALKVTVVPETGQRTLMAGELDPLFGRSTIVGHLGFVEPSPLYPRGAVKKADAGGFVAVRGVGLLRSVHPGGHRHEYTVDRLPGGQLVGELGALSIDGGDDRLAVWMTAEGTVVTSEYRPAPTRPGLTSAARWSLAPLRWHDMLSRGRRVRMALRRSVRAVGAVLAVRTSSSPRTDGAAVGYVDRQAGPGRVALFSAVHPVTGDQLLTRWPDEAEKMGYGGVTLIGYLQDAAPVTRAEPTGLLRSVEVPWAWKLGSAGDRARTRSLEAQLASSGHRSHG